jgi:signal transduction histidine kinase
LATCSITPASGLRIRSKSARAAKDGNLRILIDDDGTGLAAEQRDAVIQRGVRADEQVPGSGLGLAIVDDLARLYGGQVELADSPLGGLRAVLTVLPLQHLALSSLGHRQKSVIEQAYQY